MVNINKTVQKRSHIGTGRDSLRAEAYTYLHHYPNQ